jgi:hypothetical protein
MVQRDYGRAIERIRKSGIPVAEHFIQYLA